MERMVPSHVCKIVRHHGSLITVRTLRKVRATDMALTCSSQFGPQVCPWMWTSSVEVEVWSTFDLKASFWKSLRRRSDCYLLVITKFCPHGSHSTQWIICCLLLGLSTLWKVLSFSPACKLYHYYAEESTCYAYHKYCKKPTTGDSEWFVWAVFHTFWLFRSVSKVPQLLCFTILRVINHNLVLLHYLQRSRQMYRAQYHIL